MDELELNRRVNRIKRNQQERQQRNFDPEDMHEGTKQRKRASKNANKQRLEMLKQLATDLDLKGLLSTLQAEHPQEWWGPNTASSKKNPSFGIYLNPLGQDAEEKPCFGIWLFEEGHQTLLVIGTHPNDQQHDLAAPPHQADVLYQTAYHAKEEAKLCATLKAKLDENLPT